MFRTTPEIIRQTYKTPLIAVTGAMQPSLKYESADGITTGKLLKELVDEKGGTIFSGGMVGVGADVYAGIVQKTLEQKIEEKGEYNDNFFIMTPNWYDPNDIGAYRVDARKIKKILDIKIVGTSLHERRQKLAKTADAVIVLNGGQGTLEEAAYAIKLEKPLIILPYTGGAARNLGMLKNNLLSEEDKFHLQFPKTLHGHVHTDNIYVAESPADAIGLLRKILYK